MVRNKGFSIVELLVVIVVLALVGFIGWKVWDVTSNQPVDTVEQTDHQDGSEAAPEVKTEADLDKAEKALDETNVEGTESRELENETSF